MTTYPNNNLNDIEVDPDTTFIIPISEKTLPEYTISQQISSWLKNNLEGLTDDDDNKIFGKVNTGFNESLKTYGNKPVCDVYINQVEYSSTFEVTQPDRVNTIVLFYLKGAKNNSYMQACKVHDYVMQEFIKNPNFNQLESIVSKTYITNSELRVQPIQKNWGVIGAFELTHMIIQGY